MLKFYEIAINRNNSISMNNMGFYYKSINNIPMAKKYYQMAIEYSNISSANNLAYIYQFDEPDYDLMLYYYNLVINTQSTTFSDKKIALFLLGRRTKFATLLASESRILLSIYETKYIINVKIL